MKKEPKKRSVKIEKSSVIVLAIAAAVFIAALALIHIGGKPAGTSSSAAPQSFDQVEFERATVIEVLSEEIRNDEVADGALAGSQELNVLIKTGRYKGRELKVNNYFGPLSGVPVSAGDSVTVTVKTETEDEPTATVYEYNRIPALTVFLIQFFIIIVLVGKTTGAKSLVGLIFTVVCLFAILIPLLLRGAPTVLTTFAVCSYIALVSFTILGGVHRKTVSAFLGTLSGMLLAMVFGAAVQYFAKIDGFRLDDAEALLQLKYYGVSIKLRGLLTAGIIISALGAVMDIAMSISSSLEEVHAANPSLSRSELFRSGMNIGRDLAGTMTNTLILALLGNEFTLIIFLYAKELSFYHLFSTSFVTLEIISGVSSSIGMILAIPLTALISAALIKRKKSRAKRAR